MKKLVIGVVVIGLLAAGVLPPVFGFVAEQRLKEQLAIAPDNPQFDVTLSDYKRGLYASTATLRVSLDPAYAEALAGFDDLGDAQREALEPDTEVALTLFDKLRDGFSFDVDVKHGPISLHDGLFVGLSRSLVEITAADGELRELQDTLELPYLIRSRADTGFTGNTTAITDIPPIDYANGPDRFVFSGFELLSDINLTSLQGDYAGGVAQMSGSLEGADFVIDNITMDGDFEILSDLFSIGSARIGVGAMQIDVADEPTVTLDNLMVDVAISLDDAREFLDLDITYGVDEVAGIEGHTLTDARFNFGMQHLARDAVERYVDVSQNIDMFDPAAAEQAEQLMLASLRDIIAGSPSMAMAPVKFTFDDQSFLAQVNLDIDGTSLPPAAEIAEQLAANPALLLNLLSGTARIEAAEPLARLMAAAITRDQLAAMVTPDMGLTEADLDRQAEQQSAVMISGLIAQGMLTVEDDLLISDLEYKDGLLTINEMPIPLGAPQ